MQEIPQEIMTTKIHITYQVIQVTVLINEVELAFFRICLSQVKVGLFGFIAA